MKKVRVAVIYGGTNTEHEVSIVSARSIINNLDPKKYSILPIKITKDNRWETHLELTSSTSKKLSSIVPIVKKPKKFSQKNSFLVTAQNTIDQKKIDVIFPILHGPFGEDGTLQGMLEMMRLPYVGCGVLSSALCMDKVVQKQLCENQGISVPKFIYFTKKDWQKNKKALLKDVKKTIKYPCFVKPVNQGSSIGISKAKNKLQLTKAVNYALHYDLKTIVEKAVPHAREIECSILGNDKPKASILGEIVPSNEFYDYDAKYVDGASREIIPAKLPKKLSNKIRQTAIDSFKILNGSGMARVDFLLNDRTKKYYLNELNTLPGFTSISMYPKLWQASGLSYPKLLDKLIQLALERYQDRSEISLSYKPKTDWYK